MKRAQQGTTQQSSESISGTVERVTFHNPDNGFCVLRLKIKGQRSPIAVVGNSVTILAGEFIEAVGVWSNDKVHGLQFKASQIKPIQPTTIEGIEKYLASGLIKGVGPGYAKRLINAFGANVFDVIENSPKRLESLEGFGRKRVQSIVQGWESQKKIRDIVVFLHQHGVGTAKAVRIYKTYGDHAIEKIKDNPYRLSNEIHGIGFKTADALAESLGIPKNSLIRAQAGVKHVLQNFSNQGHCAAIRQVLVDEASEILAIEPTMIEQAIHHECEQGKLIEDDFEGQPGVFLSNFYHAEWAIAHQLKKLMKGQPVWGAIDARQAIQWVEENHQFTLSDSQRQAIELALGQKVMIITGGPGVGKTTLVNSVLKIIHRKTQNIKLCAPTGRAAKRLSESTGKEAQTIHRLLAVDAQSRGFQHNENNPIDADLLVIDETSMVDVNLMQHLLKAVPLHCAVLFVGDIDQLPSVGPGAVLFDLIRSEAIPCVRLTEIFRQAANSNIIVNAHRINQGQMLNLDNNTTELNDFYFIAANTPDEIIQKLVKVVSERIPIRFELDAVQDIQVLTPMNKGGLGTKSLNIELKKYLNIHAQEGINKFGQIFSIGDKVIQTVNNYDKDVFNGDIGVIIDLDEEESEVVIGFDEREVTYDFSELDEIQLAYAITIHKSQGSEYPAVVIPIATQHFTLLERNLLYTAVTRGKQLVIVIGQPQAVAMAIKKSHSELRLTKLANRLQHLLTGNKESSDVCHGYESTA